MNKKLIAMAVAAGLAAPMAAAQADTTIYGKFHISVDGTDSKSQAVGETTGTVADTSTYFASNSSRLGFKGSEDMGGGTKVIWQVESGVNVGDTSAGTTIGTRNTFLGVSGGWGTALGGRHDTPMKTVQRKVELFPEYVGDLRNQLNWKNTNGSAVGWDLRTPNTLAYVSPKFGGFKIVAAYVLEDGTKNMDATSVSADWSNKDIYVGLAYESHGKAWNTGGGAAPNDSTESMVRLTGSWKIAAFRLTGSYQQASNLNGISGADRGGFSLGGAFKFGGKHVIKAQYAASDKTKGLSSGAPDDASSTGAVAYDFLWSKRTTLYVAYATTTNKDGQNNMVTSGGHGGNGAKPITGEDPTSWSLGMIHKF